MRGVLVVMVLGVLLASSWSVTPRTLEPWEDIPANYAQQSLAGGTVRVSPDIVAGERFLRSVSMPEHILNPYRDDPEDEQPGDNYDDEMLVLQRRHTDHSFWTKPLTGGLVLNDVHGTAANPICICDTEFVFMNETGTGAGQFIYVVDSTHILFDNITVFGNIVQIDDSNEITITRSRILDSTFLSHATTKQTYVDNDWIGYEGIFSIIREDPIYEGPTGIGDCWPNPACAGSGIVPIGGDEILITQNYFEYAGFGTGLNTNGNMVANHNTIYNSVRGSLGTSGVNELTWNHYRGAGYAGGSVGGTGYVANNSWVLTGEAYPLREKWLQGDAMRISWSCTCTFEFNDFIGYGTHLRDEGTGGGFALANYNGNVLANNNYWGTLHDPKTPPDVWIRTRPAATTTVDTWFTEHIHDIGPFVQPINAQDIPHWLEQAPKRVLEFVPN